jgi:23S rRNA pseudouridine2605 synthase
MAQIRINKYLSLSGVTSRRGADALIAEGRVTVNDITVEKVGAIIDEESDVVKVDGTEASPINTKIYVVLNKTRGVMTTLHDPFHRRTIKHLLKDLDERVYPVGRLDFDTSGVLVLTNDGDLAYRLAHPRYQVPKIYEARVLGRMGEDSKMKIEKGIKLDDGAIGKAQVSILGHDRKESRIRLILTEGRKREVKQLCKKVGHPVRSLTRVEFGGITSRGIKPGQWRHLTPGEIASLKNLVGLNNK